MENTSNNERKKKLLAKIKESWALGMRSLVVRCTDGTLEYS